MGSREENRLNGIGGQAAPGSQREEQEVLAQRLERSLGAGKPLEEATRSRAESWFGRSLSDVRVHDSHQAAELARRLGAEALAVQSHVFGAADKLTLSTSRGRGLLAHEITHVVQQTDPPEIANGAGHVAGLPLGNVLPPSHGPGVHPVERFRSLPADSAEGTPSMKARLRPSGSAGTGHISLQVSREVLQRDAEEEARANEQTVARATDGQEEADSSDSDDANGVDPQEVAAIVYRLMAQELVVERDRAAATWTKRR